MKKLLPAAIAGAAVAFVLAAAASATEMKGLRGHSLDQADKSFEAKRQIVNPGGFDRSWKEAPPQVPHKIDREEITIRNNSCLRCHDEENFQKEKAPRIGDSHYVDAAGKKLATMNMRRWFCTQCHAPQTDVNPLVENTFAGTPFKRP